MSPLYYVFRTHDIENSYLATYFDTTYWHKFMKTNGDSGARADRFAIKDSVFVEMPIPFPLLPEQTAIGSFFQDIDQLISFQQRKLEVLKRQKKTYLKLLFPTKGQTKPALSLRRIWRWVEGSEVGGYLGWKKWADFWKWRVSVNVICTRKRSSTKIW